MTKVIKVVNGFDVTVDDDDYEYLSKHTWYDSKGYPILHGSTEVFRMGRVILNAPKELEVDHIDRDKTNYRRSNLRLVTHQVNLLNRAMSRGEDFRNIYSHRGKFQVKFTRFGQRVFIGTYNTHELAIVARDEYTNNEYTKKQVS